MRIEFGRAYSEESVRTCAAVGNKFYSGLSLGKGWEMKCLLAGEDCLILLTKGIDDHRKSLCRAQKNAKGCANFEISGEFEWKASEDAEMQNNGQVTPMLLCQWNSSENACRPDQKRTCKQDDVEERIDCHRRMRVESGGNGGGDAGAEIPSSIWRMKA
eukprot:gnl/TRDRNA2_/TRDRNA2_175513_c1_seq2.p1 gnl/TRDRNA2_/TRDRNA2_175513_c1~~gnl/TRDRNA2_/TRDRNA2_175513_c1_seq2.p1  ORF type:complete len:159 (-),score=7.34 gnl/TRDRNA2_/TRDRNA2_175513_c1_seq2:49-525(-)